MHPSHFFLFTRMGLKGGKEVLKGQKPCSNILAISYAPWTLTSLQELMADFCSFQLRQTIAHFRALKSSSHILYHTNTNIFLNCLQALQSQPVRRARI